MWSLFHRIPIRSKLRLIILATCTIVLCVVCAGLFAVHYFTLLKQQRSDVETVSGITAQMGSQTVASANNEAIHALLLAVEGHTNIESAFVQLPNGNILGKSAQQPTPDFLHKQFADGFTDIGQQSVYAKPMIWQAQRIGTLLIVANFREQTARLPNLYIGILVCILLISTIVAMLVGSRLEPIISNPIHQLAETARRIGARNDYSLRAEVISNDEVGLLTEAFNKMLEKIQNRDAALRYEISERARAEQALHKAQQQLVEASRQEGMADVAACVLHNVGNVLNSVNVSATLIADTLRHSRAENLQKAGELLRQNMGQLEHFLRDNPKGQLLPNYLLEASDHIMAERSQTLGEVDLLLKNIEHIKEIVAMQQRYARSSGVIEELEIEHLVEDAMRLNASAFQNHSVTLVRDYQPVPPVRVDKHKVLQVLVNLLRNARFALDDAAPPKKRLTVSIRQQADGFVEIAVDDNGIGITEQNLQKIFSYGFTTRTEGQGFGLHSGAIAAQQMGGRLVAHSDGHMRGATFTLVLPIAGKKQ